MKFDKYYYLKDALTLAEDLLGKVIVRRIDKNFIRARIVETEAYTGENDRACHTYNGKKTKRTKTMYESGGCLYIYTIYGMYEMLNIVSGPKNSGEAVLIRAVEILNEFDIVSNNRYKKDYNKLSSYEKKNLSNGPAKVSMALKIDKSYNAYDLMGDEIYIENDNFDDFIIVKAKRIGIDYAKEAKDYLYRFYIKSNKNVSKI